MPGIWTSSTRQDAVSTASELRNASADANATAVNPIDLNKFVAASRTDSSSSTIAMRGPSGAVLPFMLLNIRRGSRHGPLCVWKIGYDEGLIPLIRGYRIQRLDFKLMRLRDAHELRDGI